MCIVIASQQTHVRYFWEGAVFSTALSHQDNEVLAGAPEDFWISDSKHILLVGIALQQITAGWVHGENLSRLGVQLDFLVHADVNLGEIILVEVGLQHLITLDDSLFFQLFSCTKHKPSGVKLLILAVDYL